MPHSQGYYNRTVIAPGTIGSLGNIVAVDLCIAMHVDEVVLSFFPSEVDIEDGIVDFAIWLHEVEAIEAPSFMIMSILGEEVPKPEQHNTNEHVTKERFHFICLHLGK